MMVLGKVCRCGTFLQHAGGRFMRNSARSVSSTGSRTRPLCNPTSVSSSSSNLQAARRISSVGPRANDLVASAPASNGLRASSPASAASASTAASAAATSVADGELYKVNISDTRCNVSLTAPGKRDVHFHTIWLRHNCHCELCKQDHSGQKVIHPASLLATYTVVEAYIEENYLKISFAEEPDHVTIIPLDFLLNNDYSSETRLQQQTIRQPLVAKGDLPTIGYGEVLDTKKGLLRWLQMLNDYGICLVKDVPTEDGMVKEAIGRAVESFWPVQRTIYGEIFDVVSTPSPINVAYSNVELGFHMDLVYYESPPGIQFLHCMRFDECVEGGDSVFLDSYAVAEELRQHHPEDFDALVRIPASFQKIHFERERPVYMKYRRHHIVLTPEGEITGINWAPPFEAPLCVKEEDVEPYYKAYRKFAQMLENSNLKLKTRLEQGDLISFNNRRILHARDSFVLNGGMRHLQGCYLNIDEFKSQLDVLNQLHGDKAPSRRTFNQCGF